MGYYPILVRPSLLLEIQANNSSKSGEWSFRKYRSIDCPLTPPMIDGKAVYEKGFRVDVAILDNTGQTVEWLPVTYRVVEKTTDGWLCEPCEGYCSTCDPTCKTPCSEKAYERQHNIAGVNG